MTQQTPRILVADDQAPILAALELLLADEGFEVETARSPQAILAAVEAREFDAVLMDLNYARDTTSGREGLDLLPRLQVLDPTLPVIVMTAWSSVDGAVEAMRNGARDYVEKPWDDTRLVATLRTQVELGRALRRTQRLEHENRELRRQQAGGVELIAESAAMQPVMRLMERVAPSDANVLVLGEHGTGKEMVARWLHAAGTRRTRPFVTVDMGGLAEGVFESELFGHVKGAFTDARADRPGRFELADGGTVFLDEIGNMSHAQQAKLLRVLQTGEIERVGSTRTRRLDVRVIAATNADLRAAVAAGQFREDLLYRLNTVEIRLPPLRTRREDIPVLAAHFLQRHAARYRKPLSGFDAGAVAALLAHPWPGNVRELSHAVERAVLMAQGAQVRASDLALRDDRDGGRGPSLEEMPLEDVERLLIQKALARAQGNVSHAARALGRGRRALAHDRVVQLLALAGGAPAVVVALLWVWRTDAPEETRWTSSGLLVGAWLVGAMLARAQVVRPLHALANMLAALRAGDYSLRARRGDPDEALGLVLHELNALSGLLFEQRLGALEAGALLRHVIANVDVAVFAFDDAARLRLVNPEGQRLLAAPAERLLGRTAAELGLGALVADEEAGDGIDAPPASGTSRVTSLTLPGGAGRFEVRRGGFRQGGRPHVLLLVTDLSATLRAEERQAWQRLVRVMSHEINNSLAPIKSIAGSLQRRLTSGRPRTDGPPRDPSLPASVAGGDTPLPMPSLSSTPVAGTPAADAFAAGLGVIAERAEALSRFIGAYARLSRLPPPRPRAVDVAALARRVVALETRLPVRVGGEGSAWVRADPDQLEQLLINLVRNAVDAALETRGGVEIRWDAHTPAGVRVFVEDEGPGVAESSNLFVPFYSTKPDGSGIGLALSRQIAEAHGGTLTLTNRPDRRGARAELTLPR